MLTVYSNGVGYPISNDDYYVRQLASGLDEIVFNVFIRDDVYKYIAEEAIVRDRDQQEYLIKQIDQGSETAKVVAQINIDDWKAAMYLDYTNNSDTVRNTIAGVAPAGWSVVDQSQKTMRRTIPTSDTTQEYNVTAFEIIQACCDTYSVRVRFDTLNKIIYIINPDLYSSIGAFATRDLNLKKLNYKGKSDNFVTRLYAVGADGMTFASINDNKPYVENYSYSNKIISAFWKDERYTDKQSLLDDATERLAEMAQPTRSYDCEVLDLAKTNPDMYGFENFALFNIVTLVDDAKEERVDYQIVEKWEYPYYPVQNKVVLSTQTPNLQSVVTQIVSALNNPVSVFSQKLQSAVIATTALITGNKGGYLVLHDSNGDGTPDELLIMDTDNIETATKVWRWNQQGLGYSGTGYNGPYTLGMNMLGQINADMITAGVLNGEIIEAGTIQANAFSVAAREELNITHNYIAADVCSNINRWVSKGAAIDWPTIETIEGTTYAVIDGTGLSEFNSDAWVSCSTDFFGSANEAQITVHYKFVFDRTVTFERQQILGYRYFSYLDEQWHEITRYAGDGTWHEGQAINVTTPNFVVNAYVSNESANNMRVYAIPGCKIYYEILTMTSTSANYASAGLTYTADGLTSTVKKGNIISTINQSAEAVTIEASKINLSGALSLNGDFHCYDADYDPDVPATHTYAFLDDGNLSFYYQGSNVFTIASTPLLGNKAGIFFGDVEDPSSMADYTHINQDEVTTPRVYVKTDDRYSTWLWPAVVEGGVKCTEVDADVCSFHGRSNDACSFVGNVLFYNFGQGTSDVKFLTNVLNASGSTVFISDKRKKRNIKDLAIDAARSFIMALKPREFKFTKDISNSNRKHHGFIAQEVKKAMHEDWGLYCESKKDDFIGLRYDELIADIVAVMQDQEKRIEALERRVDDLTNNQS